MQEKNNKIPILKNKIGEIFKELREKKENISINQMALIYEIDKGTLSKLERGIYDCRISTAIKVCEAYDIKFSDFAKLLEKKLGENFRFNNDTDD